jgi:hypothetical protein
MRLAITVSILALSSVAGAQATVGKGTLSGVVTRGPITPVCVAEQPCDEPAANVRLVFTRNDSVAGSATTDRAGDYRLRLPAGSYSVRRASVRTSVDRKLEPNHVRIYAGRSSRIDFSIDTGIR